jgi:hypothetical protein
MKDCNHLYMAMLVASCTEAGAISQPKDNPQTESCAAGTYNGLTCFPNKYIHYVSVNFHPTRYEFMKNKDHQDSYDQLPPQPTDLPPAGITDVDIVQLSGRCIQIVLANEPLWCTGKMIYTHFIHNGRTAFSITALTINNDELLIWFSGGSDIQSTRNHYTLIVDTVRITINLKRIDYNAEGTCVSNINDEGSVANSVICHALLEDGRKLEIGLDPGLATILR